ncbi:DUF934 domain-containing protein [Uliginosibacterium sp. H3]|uniref:DUF934 domain-containing protein n=1 Tax=Uliginosibacterium silvisoli TaxID=3114758 RepID=A0ABU6K2V9_9RHOO|nr:DUF934 domain-containing protein [Uliginosibacterium sp. H3]
MSNLIKQLNGSALIATDDDWQIVRLPAVQEEVKKQAGKVVLFKLTNAETATPELIAATEVPAGKVILPLSVWLARKSEFAARVAAGEIGVWLETHELVETLFADQPDLNVFPVIGVFIERHPDGRAYSTSSLLRTRFGFRNELRAFGDVLRDQLFFLNRCGFTSFEIRADRSAQDALASLKDFSEPYQAAVVIDQPVWRRHARV